MLRKIMPTCFSVLFCLMIAAYFAQAQTASPPSSAKTAPAQQASSLDLTVEQVIAKNIEAHGGLEKWRVIKTMTETGRIDAGTKANAMLPFRLAMMRPRKSRLEIDFDGQVAVQAYDGTQGWTLRPYLGRTEPEPYRDDELKKAAEQQDLDGPLVDYAAKGTKVELVGMEPVENHDAYKIKLTYNTNTVRHIWVDANSFLEIKMEEPPRVMDGRPRPVTTWFRDYRTVDGLVIPFLYETAVQGYSGTHKMVVEKVELNPKLDDSAFGKPQSLPPGALMRRPRPIVKPANAAPSPKGVVPAQGVTPTKKK